MAGFQAGPSAWPSWNLEMLVFVQGGKPENPEKNPRGKARTNNKLSPHVALGAHFSRVPKSFRTRKVVAKSQTLDYRAVLIAYSQYEQRFPFHKKFQVYTPETSCMKGASSRK